MKNRSFQTIQLRLKPRRKENIRVFVDLRSSYQSVWKFPDRCGMVEISFSYLFLISLNFSPHIIFSPSASRNNLIFFMFFYTIAIKPDVAPSDFREKLNFSTNNTKTGETYFCHFKFKHFYAPWLFKNNFWFEADLKKDLVSPLGSLLVFFIFPLSSLPSPGMILIFRDLTSKPTADIENGDHSATKEINVLRIKHLICNWWSFSQLSLTLRLTKNIYNFFFV